jgi:hypothetical protein
LRAIASADGAKRIAEGKEKDVNVVLWVMVSSVSCNENEWRRWEVKKDEKRHFCEASLKKATDLTGSGEIEGESLVEALLVSSSCLAIVTKGYFTPGSESEWNV